MSTIRPFRGLRPRPEVARTVASPPYDVLSSDEARALVADNPDSFLRVNKPEVDFPPDTDAYGREIYERGKANLERLVRDGLMFRDDEPCFYLYRLTWRGRSQTGLVALTSTAEYDSNLIKKHEHTRPIKVSDRADHIETLGAQVGPVFSIFRARDSLEAIFARATAGAPEYDYESDEVRHQMWVVSDEATIASLVAGFAELPALYIADGHHRSAASSEVARRRREALAPHTPGCQDCEFFLNVIFSDRETRILPYNRAVKGLNGLTPADFLARVGESFDVATVDGPFEPDRPYCYGMYLAGTWYRLTLKAGLAAATDPAEAIDSAVLTRTLLTPVLGITDLRTASNIDFIGGIRGPQELSRIVDAGRFDVAFSLYPASVAQLLAVADANQVMPPKSTWFEPKLRSGMVVNLLSD